MANLIGIYIMCVRKSLRFEGLVRAFHFDTEYNVPTVYSATAIFIASIILLVIARAKKHSKESIYWRGLSLIFLFLSLDEIFKIHEATIPIGKSLLGSLKNVAALEYPWFVIYIPVLSIISLFFIKFFFQLPNITKIRFIISGIVFIFGAVGVEMINIRYLVMHDWSDPIYQLLITAEELLEMLGIILFIRALLQYALTNLPAASITYTFAINGNSSIKRSPIPSSMSAEVEIAK
jgi:hypothetical protein